MNKTKNGKIVFSLVFVILLALLYYQNREFFDHHGKLRLNLLFHEFNVSPLPVGFYCLICLLFGFFTAYFAGLIRRFKDNKRIQILENDLRECTKRLCGEPEGATGEEEPVLCWEENESGAQCQAPECGEKDSSKDASGPATAQVGEKTSNNASDSEKTPLKQT